MTLRAPGPATVHLWRIPLAAGGLRGAPDALSPDERERAVRILDPHQRARWCAARAALRSILGAYLDAPAGALGFRYGALGKPELDAPWATSGLRFNLSHCGERALLAVAAGREVGVDLEAEREVSHAERVAPRVFPAPDLAWWRSLPPERRREGFFRLWTRLEALAKLRGGGVWRVARAEGAGCLQHPEVVELRVPPGFAAALAAEGGVGEVVERDWRGA